ncbi:hypothetical protein LL912_19250 [Niabella sp. CC-SYL272]|uniref:hypothetical protein n=1 Tax=Niabella agricola TaxID=2891571 RepID=UPI001F2A74C6|nr:hypothetical protein [Niabella agricola]MCF3110931.1 hypothetical protein [Niabella agricola]
MLPQWLCRSIHNNSRRKIYEQLQWQRFLLRTGVPATIRVLDLVEETDRLPDYIQLRLWVLLRRKGMLTYQHMQTLVRKEQIPGIGDLLRIRYCPDDPSRILILSTLQPTKGTVS